MLAQVTDFQQSDQAYLDTQDMQVVTYFYLANGPNTKELQYAVDSGGRVG